MKTTEVSVVEQLQMLQPIYRNARVTVSGQKSDGTWFSGELYYIDPRYITLTKEDEEVVVMIGDIVCLAHDYVRGWEQLTVRQN